MIVPKMITAVTAPTATQEFLTPMNALKAPAKVAREIANRRVEAVIRHSSDEEIEVPILQPTEGAAMRRFRLSKSQLIEGQRQRL